MKHSQWIKCKAILTIKRDRISVSYTYTYTLLIYHIVLIHSTTDNPYYNIILSEGRGFIGILA